MLVSTIEVQTDTWYVTLDGKRHRRRSDAARHALELDLHCFWELRKDRFRRCGVHDGAAFSSILSTFGPELLEIFRSFEQNESEARSPGTAATPDIPCGIDTLYQFQQPQNTVVEAAPQLEPRGAVTLEDPSAPRVMMTLADLELGLDLDRPPDEVPEENPF